MTRPSPALPRRKSTSRMFWRTAPGAASANTVATAPATGRSAGGAEAAGACEPSMVTTRSLPSSADVYVRLRARFITRRVRLAVWTTDTLLRSPSPASTCVLPRPLVGVGKVDRDARRDW